MLFRDESSELEAARQVTDHDVVEELREKRLVLLVRLCSSFSHRIVNGATKGDICIGKIRHAVVSDDALLDEPRELRYPLDSKAADKA